VRQYQYVLKHEEFAEHVRDEFLPQLKDIPGFISFYLLDVGEEGGRMMSVSFFEDEAGVEEFNRRTTEWVRSNLGTFQAATVVETGPVVAIA
jgi:heme-degrading monooxygenase HmoA